MKLKANLHFHSADDPIDSIKYSFFEAIQTASRFGFGIIALTCHNFFVEKPEYREYALSKNILLINGIELSINGKHVVILNSKKDIESVKSFDDLRDYKKSNPEIFVFAPHPFFYGNFSLKKELLRNIDLFDAIESSWFYSKWFNRNIKAETVAKKYHLPFIATSDTHDLSMIDKSYAVIEVPEKTAEAVFAAIKSSRFENFNKPKKFWREMFFVAGRIEIRNHLRRLDRKRR